MAGYDFANLTFDLETTPLEKDPAVIFTLDKMLRIRSCNLAWDRFASANAGARLDRRAVQSRPLMDFIRGDSLRDFYLNAYRSVQATGLAWGHAYECSSPDTTRQFQMLVHPIQGGLLVINSLAIEEPHSTSAVQPLDANYRTRDGLIVMCSNCRRSRRVGLEEIWDWVPSFVSSAPRPVSHGLCPPCVEQYKLTWGDVFQ